MKTSDFDYSLPSELIAQTPIEPRDSSRLMVLDRAGGSWQHRRFHDLPALLKPGDVLVCNDSRVLPARLFGVREGTGGKVEILLLRRLEAGLWEALTKPAKRLAKGTKLAIKAEPAGARGSTAFLEAEIVEEREDGLRVVHFSDEKRLEDVGRMPLPPYIHHRLEQPSRYQTVYARADGSAAAPTAGLHFTPRLMEELKSRGVRLCFVTIHIGLDTFLPVRVEDPRTHPIHTEYGEISEETAREVSMAKAEGRRVVAVGTSSVRLLEHAFRNCHEVSLPCHSREGGNPGGHRRTAGLDSGSRAGMTSSSAVSRFHRDMSDCERSKVRGQGDGLINPFKGWVDLFVLPGHTFHAVDAMVTNFHLPRSTLVMLVSAFAGRDFILHAYEEAMKERYRFYSFGDAMLIF